MPQLASTSRLDRRAGADRLAYRTGVQSDTEPGPVPPAGPAQRTPAAWLIDILEDADQLEDHRGELVDLRRWLSLDRIDRHAVNEALAADAVTGTSAA